MDGATLRKIIVDGDAEQMVKTAEELGEDLARRLQLTTSQIRTVFVTVRRIEMGWPRGQRSADEDAAAQHAYRELQLLKPKMAYQAQREQERKRGRGVEALVGVLTEAIDLVDKDRGRFENFVDFFEAILAYHKAKGGKN